MKSCSTEKLMNKTKNGENLPSFEMVRIVLEQSSLVNTRCQRKSQVLYTFMPNNSHVYMLNVEPSNLLFLKTNNTDFHNIIIKFTDQNSRPLEIEDKVNLKLLIVIL